jgi:hypothetical protein
MTRFAMRGNINTFSLVDAAGTFFYNVNYSAGITQITAPNPTTLMAQDGFGWLTGKVSGVLGANWYNDGTNNMRIDTASPAWIIENYTTTDEFHIYRAPPGPNPIGTNYETFLKINSAGIQSLPKQPACRAYRTTAQSIPDSTWTSIAFDAENFDTQNMHDNVTNNTRITIPPGGDGIYLIAAGIGFAANGTGIRGVRFYKNGTTIIAAANTANPGAAYVGRVVLTTVESLVAGDYVEVQAWQNSGAALNTLSGSENIWFAVHKLS